MQDKSHHKRSKGGKVLYDFVAEYVDELTITANDRILVLDYSTSAEWWLCSSRNKIGLVPASYVSLDLPVGWGASIADDGQKWYYFNNRTGVVQWEYPGPHEENKEGNIVRRKETLPELKSLQRSREECEIDLQLLHERLDRSSTGVGETIHLPIQPTHSYSGGDVVWLQDSVACIAKSAVMLIDAAAGQHHPSQPPSEIRQRALCGHSHDVVSLTVHPNDKYLASGDTTNTIVVWDMLNPQEPLATFVIGQYGDPISERTKIGPKKIRSIRFSPNGLLLAILLDGGAVEIYLWQKKSCVCYTKGRNYGIGGGSFFSLQFNPVILESQRFGLVSLGSTQIKFWTLSPSNISTKNDEDRAHDYRLEGNLWTPKSKTQPSGAPEEVDMFKCMTFAHDKESDTLASIYTGTQTGKIYIWQQMSRKFGRTEIKYPKPFGRLIAVVNDVSESAITAIAAHNNHLITCDPISVSMWKLKHPESSSATTSFCPLEHFTTFDLPHTEGEHSVGHGISVCFHSGNNSDNDSNMTIEHIQAVMGTSEKKILLITPQEEELVVHCLV